jgi:hypothetical protein
VQVPEQGQELQVLVLLELQWQVQALLELPCSVQV